MEGALNRGGRLDRRRKEPETASVETREEKRSFEANFAFLKLNLLKVTVVVFPPV